MKTIQNDLRIIIFLAALCQKTQTNTEQKTQFSFYGFGRTTLFRDNKDLGRSDLFVPANIPIAADQSPDFVIGAKQKRFGFNVSHKIGDKIVTIKIEMGLGTGVSKYGQEVSR